MPESSRTEHAEVDERQTHKKGTNATVATQGAVLHSGGGGRGFSPHSLKIVRAADITALQRAIGNRAVFQFLHPMPKTGFGPRPSTQSLSHQAGVIAVAPPSAGLSAPELAPVVELGKGVARVGSRADSNHAAHSRQLTGPSHAVQRQVIQRKPKTEKDKFLAKTFKLKGFTPSTGVGKFDVEYSPKKGEMKVIVKLHFDFTDVSDDYKGIAANKDEIKWKAAQKKQWIKDFGTQILDVWGDIGQINCQKDDWEDITVKPKIVVASAGKGKGHFDVKVDKAFTTNTGKNRTATGGTSVGGLGKEDQADFQEHDNKDKINDPKVSGHLSGTETTTNIQPAILRDQERMDELLAKMPALAFKAGEELVEGENAGIVQEIGRAIVGLRKDSALAKLHPVKVVLPVLAGDAPTLADLRFIGVRALLINAGVPNPISLEKSPAQDAAARVARGDAPGISDAYVANWKRITVAHEFGHMIGLLDEYCPAVSPELLEMMVAEGRLKPDFVMTERAKGKVSQTSAKQGAYAKMLKANDLETPTWARPTSSADEKSTSLMSGGFEILKQHYVTIWEALGAATTPTVTKEEWKVG